MGSSWPTRSISEHALYRYSPATRLRNDITAAVTLSLQPRRSKRTQVTRGENENTEFVVVMARTWMLSLRPTKLPLSADDMEGFRADFEGWADTMTTTTRDTLHPVQNAS